MITTLDGKQREQLIDALLTAFPKHQDLEMFIDFELHEKVEHIARIGTLKETTYDIVQWVEKQSRTEELIQAARRRNPTNHALKQFISSIHFKNENTAITKTLTTLLNPPIEGKPEVFPASALLTSRQCSLTLRNASFYREELFLAPKDAARCGVTGESGYAILAIPSLNSGAPPRQYAVRLVSSAQIAPSTIQINSHFAEDIGLQQASSASWWITRAAKTVVLEEAVVELVVESENIERERKRLSKSRLDFL